MAESYSRRFPRFRRSRQSRPLHRPSCHRSALSSARTSGSCRSRSTCGLTSDAPAFHPCRRRRRSWQNRRQSSRRRRFLRRRQYRRCRSTRRDLCSCSAVAGDRPARPTNRTTSVRASSKAKDDAPLRSARWSRLILMMPCWYRFHSIEKVGFVSPRTHAQLDPVQPPSTVALSRMLAACSALIG